MTEPLRTWLEERETIHGRATEGPWEAEGLLSDKGTPYSIVEMPRGRFASLDYTNRSFLDATAIVDAHNTLPKLLAGVRAVLDVLDAGVRDGDDAVTIRLAALFELQEAINDD